MGDGDEFIASEIGLVKCPKCGNDMVELIQDYGGMTEGQQADYEMGFNRPFECPECSHYGLFDVDVPNDDIDYDSFEIEETEIPITIDEISTYSTMLGIIIKEAIEIEYHLDKIIEEYYIDNLDKKEKFEKDVLRKEFFSFEQKRQIFVRMDFRDIDRGFYEKIRWIQEIRNQVVHILGEFDKEKRVYCIKYKQGKEEKEIILDKKFIQDFQMECYTIKKKLLEITNVLKIKKTKT